MKRLIPLLLALVMIMSLATTAFAAEPTTGTIVNTTNRTYNAYQIFSGTQADGDAVLGNIGWGTGINVGAFLPELKTLSVEGTTPFAGVEDAADVAGILANKADNSAIAKEFAKLAYNYVTGTAPQIAAATADGNATVTLNSGYYLLIDTSTTNPTQNLALLQVTNKSTLNITMKAPGAPEAEKKIKEGENLVDETDASIGDRLTFVLTATIPESLEGYDSYKLVFHDELSPGLRFSSSVTITVDGESISNHFNAIQHETLEDGTHHVSWESKASLFNILEPGMVITLTYDAILDKDAVIREPGNPNSFWLEYSNNPNVETETSETPPDVVIVYTWEIPVYKYTGSEENKEPLAGAGFTLYTDEACTDPVELCVPAEGSNIYKLYWNTKSPSVDPDPQVTEIITDNTGRFEIEGLKPGTYYLKETTTPAGYNTCNVITVVIGEDGSLTQDGDTTTEVGVLNNAGSTLPETGGMGTTLFYVLGGIMVLAAVILLVTKKRMGSVE